MITREMFEKATEILKEMENYTHVSFNITNTMCIEFRVPDNFPGNLYFSWINNNWKIEL